MLMSSMILAALFLGGCTVKSDKHNTEIMDTTYAFYFGNNVTTVTQHNEDLILDMLDDDNIKSDSCFVLTPYADWSANVAKNKQVAMKRAISVANALVKLGKLDKAQIYIAPAHVPAEKHSPNPAQRKVEVHIVSVQDIGSMTGLHAFASMPSAKPTPKHKAKPASAPVKTKKVSLPKAADKVASVSAETQPSPSSAKKNTNTNSNSNTISTTKDSDEDDEA